MEVVDSSEPFITLTLTLVLGITNRADTYIPRYLPIYYGNVIFYYITYVGITNLT